MLFRHVERFEVVVVVFDLGAFEYLVAETGEDVLHLLAHEAERMAMAEHGCASGQRDVHGVGRAARGGERGFALGEGRFDARLERVHELAERAAIAGRQRGQLRHEVGDPAGLAAGPADLQPLERALARRRRSGIARRERRRKRRVVLRDEAGQFGEGGHGQDHRTGTGDWGLGTGDWGLGRGASRVQKNTRRGVASRAWCSSAGGDGALLEASS